MWGEREGGRGDRQCRDGKAKTAATASPEEVVAWSQSFVTAAPWAGPVTHRFALASQYPPEEPVWPVGTEALVSAAAVLEAVLGAAIVAPPLCWLDAGTGTHVFRALSQYPPAPLASVVTQRLMAGSQYPGA